MRLCWITDPHLNHCTLPAWDRLVAQVRRCGCDAVLLSGDISEGEDVVFQLKRLADAFQLPIHFVLGNHDFYRSSFDRTVRAVSSLAEQHPLLDYLTPGSPRLLDDKVVLVGEDGWGDATTGDFERSPVRLNDFLLIEDFHLAATEHWKPMLIELGQQAAERLQAKLDAALASSNQVLVVTHVPPFRQACWYQGKTTDDNWAPFFVCGQTGEVLRATAGQHRQAKIEVICGHTHNGGVAQIEDNLVVTTGGAEYGAPAVTAIIELAAEGFLIEPVETD